MSGLDTATIVRRHVPSEPPRADSIADRNRSRVSATTWRVSIFGNFGTGNTGNESTLQAILYQLRQRFPNAEVTCICADPEVAAKAYNIKAVSTCAYVVRPWAHRNALMRLVRKALVGIPSELYRWFQCFKTLRGTDLLIVPGTGLLNDAYGVWNNWGPYSLCKWSLAAKLTGCKVMFVSVGAGPLYSRLGRLFVKTSLSLAEFRSYRDVSTQEYLKSIGFVRENDRIYPDLVFGYPETLIRRQAKPRTGRKTVGIGLMEYAGKYSVARPSAEVQRRYLESLLDLSAWLLGRGYDLRLLVGDTCDIAVAEELRGLLKRRFPESAGGRVIAEPTTTVDQLLAQLADTDMVVGTRFHNVLWSLLFNRPVIAISFHHKCTSLMSYMGLEEYCQNINDVRSEWLIERFGDLERNAERVKATMAERVSEFRSRLDEQYDLLFEGMLRERRSGGEKYLNEPVNKIAR